MSTDIRHITKAENPRPKKSRARVEFDERMVMINYLVGEAEDKNEAEVYFRQMMEQCRYLSRKFGFKIS